MKIRFGEIPMVPENPIDDGIVVPDYADDTASVKE